MKSIAPNLKKYCNLNELLFDFSVSVILWFSLDYILPGGRSLIELYSPLALYAIVLAATFFLMLFLAEIYKGFIESTNIGMLIFLIKVIFFFSITAIYLVILTFYSSLHILPWNMQVHSELNMIFYLIPVYPIIWGISIGFSGRFDEIRYTLYLPGTMAVIMVPVFSLIVGYHIHWWLAPLVFILQIVLLAGPLILVRLASGKRSDEFQRQILAVKKEKGRIGREDIPEIERRVDASLKGNGLMTILRSFWMNLLFPVLAAVGIILWQKVTVEMFIQAYANWHRQPDMNVIFWSLIWSGIVPVRILSTVAPPWKLINSLIASGTLVWYIFYLYRNFH